MSAIDMGLTRVVLVGSLGRAPGVNREEWDLDVKSPAEAVRAIDINTRGALAAYLRGPAAKRAYKVAVQERSNVIGADEVTHRSGRSTIYIMPTIRGRDKGVGKILFGAALIALAFVPGVQGFAFAGLKAGFASNILIGFGTSLVLGGIAQILTPNPQGPAPDVEQAQSTAFAGNATAVVQGGCVPVVYGRALVPAIPVSITVENNDVSLTDAGTVGTVDTTELEGGGTQYTSTEE